MGKASLDELTEADTEEPIDEELDEEDLINTVNETSYIRIKSLPRRT